MGSVMKPLATSAIFVDLMAKVKEIPILGVALGTIMTLVVQSSSATIAVTAEFCSSAWTGWCDERNGISRCNSDPSW